MSGLCRLCAETRPLEKMNDISEPALNIEQKLVDCCRWTHLKELELNENLPQHICIVCIEKLEQCWMFAENVANAQYKLIETIRNSKLDPFDDDDDEDDTTYDYYWGDRVDNLPESPVEINVYVEVNENQQINTQDSEANPIEDQSNESTVAKRSTITKKHNKKIKSQKSKSVDKTEKKSNQMNLDQNEDERNPSKGESSFHSSNFANNFLQLLKKDDRNHDGSVNSDTIQRLGLVNWMVLQHQCWVCLTCFCSHYELKAHITSEHSIADLRYMCSICKSKGDSSYGRRAYLHRHIMRKHFPHLKYCCLRCNKFFWNLAKLREHNATHALKPYRDKLAVLCHECGGLFTESKLRAHALTHLPIEQKPIFECYICKRTYACRISLRNHWPDHVGGRKRFKCSTCDKDFARRDSLRRHQGIHKGELPFFCIECGKKFRSKKSLQNHKNIHSNSKPFGCPIPNCEYRCSDSSNVFKHIRQKHGLPSGHGLKVVRFTSNFRGDNNS